MITHGAFVANVQAQEIATLRLNGRLDFAGETDVGRVRGKVKR